MATWNPDYSFLGSLSNCLFQKAAWKVERNVCACPATLAAIGFDLD
jgi:hypothetical protein